MKLDWTNAKFANGPMVESWLVSSGMVPDRRPDWIARRLWNWRTGSQAQIFALDHVLTSMGMHLSEVPEDIWEERRTLRRHGKLEDAIKLYRTGVSLSECEREVGIHRKTIKAEVNRLGIYRGPQGSTRIPKERVAEIRSLRSAGLSRRMVAQRLGVAHKTVVKYEEAA